MKRIFIILFATVLAVFCFIFAGQEKKRVPTGSHIFNSNYISTKTFPGKNINTSQFIPDDLLDITIDGKMEEDSWSQSQVINSFYTSDRKLDNGVKVSVISDKENIYLFWKVEDSTPIIADIVKNDSALVGDDYVQVNLKPIMPESIKYARDYSFSIAVNPNGALWDAYFDPYGAGYFFMGWPSKTKLKAVKNENGYCVEMTIPFSDLDIYSDPGWKWNLTFNRAKGDKSINSISSTGITVVQNIKVRDPALIGYYWTRSEFWTDVIPDLKDIKKPQSKATKLNRVPTVNKKLDNVWSSCEEISLAYDNKMAVILEEKTAKASVGYNKDNLYLLLQSPNPYPIVKTDSAGEQTARGMKHQVAGLNGVYRDLSIETSESFWILFQPSSINGDAPHQDYYFITVDFLGKTTKTRYDSHGKPDKGWDPQLETDVFKSSDNWGIELTIPLNDLNIPFDCSSVWKMNIMYNIPLEEGNSVEGLSKIQAWYPTLKDEKNPTKSGRITSLEINYDKYVKNAFEKRAGELSDDISALKGINKKEMDSLNKKLAAIGREITLGNPEKIKNELDLLDIKIGIAEEKISHNNSPNVPNDGYSLNDVHFINSLDGFAVGAMGLILHTSDGGKTWIKQQKLTDYSLSEIFFVNENEGWIAGGRIRSAETNELMRHDERGGDGIILHTENSGATWEIQFANRGAYLFGIFFTDNENGWAVGEGGLLIHTADGGNLWSLLPTTGTTKWLNGVYFFDKLNGFIVGESETVLKTKDGGNRWEKINAEADRKFYDFRSFYRDITFIGNKGWIVGQNGTILATRDNGTTWEPQATEFDERVRELMDLRKVCFIDEENGFAVGGLGTRIMKTDNGGESWSLIRIPNNDQINGAWFHKNGTGYIAGGRSKILETTDNGRTWATVNGSNKNVDLMIFTAHGDDSPIQHGVLMTYLSKIENKDIAAIHIMKDTHSNEYKGEYYNYECDRSHDLIGVKTTMHFDEFDNGNAGCRSFHVNMRLWKGYDEIARHMVAAIRAYRPDVVLTHEPVYGEYDKPGHKVSGRAGFMAFYNSGEPDQYPELTRLGLKPYQAKKLYTYATKTFPATYQYEYMFDVPLEGYGETAQEWANRSLRCFQSQGVQSVWHTPLHLVKSYVTVSEEEKSLFDGIE